MDSRAFTRLATTAYADVITRDRVMDHGVRPQWTPMPRIAGPAFPVRNEPADNLMPHLAIHRAPAGAVIVCQAAGDEILRAAEAKAAQDAATSLEDWVRAHRDTVDALAKKLGIDA